MFEKSQMKDKTKTNCDRHHGHQKKKKEMPSYTIENSPCLTKMVNVFLYPTFPSL